MSELRLVVFDVDGTLVDSEADIVRALTRAFEATGRIAPEPAALRATIGMSIESAMAHLAPEAGEGGWARLAEGYRRAYFEERARRGAAELSPLFPGVREMLARLAEDPWILLGIATGKSRRGLTALIEAHGLEGVFATTQVADDHPSKPHPSMLLTAMAETGVAPERAVMVGDTRYDIDMARAARVKSIGVGWGAHPPATLGADALIGGFDELPAAIDRLIGGEE